MHATPENAEAALVDGLVTPSTTWWMRCTKLSMAGCDVNNLFFSYLFHFSRARDCPGMAAGSRVNNLRPKA
jgi:hypothetical protein